VNFLLQLMNFECTLYQEEWPDCRPNPLIARQPGVIGAKCCMNERFRKPSGAPSTIHHAQFPQLQCQISAVRKACDSP
jgi:hypothetical protein